MVIVVSPTPLSSQGTARQLGRHDATSAVLQYLFVCVCVHVSVVDACIDPS